MLALRDQIGLMGRSGHTRESFVEADLDFHRLIGAASGNPLMRSVTGVIEAALVASRSQSSPIDDWDDHAVTVDAIEAQDEQAAAAAMLEAINIGYRRINCVARKHL